MKSGIYDAFEKHIDSLLSGSPDSKRAFDSPEEAPQGQRQKRNYILTTRPTGRKWINGIPSRGFASPRIIQRMTEHKIEELLRRVRVGEFLLCEVITHDVE